MILDLSFFLIHVFSGANFPLNTAFAAYHKFCCVFIFNYFKIFSNFSWDFFLTHALFRSVLSNLHVLWDFPVMFLLLISTLIPLWSDSRRCMTSIILNMLKFALWLRISSILVSIHSVLKYISLYRTLHSITAGCSFPPKHSQNIYQDIPCACP